MDITLLGEWLKYALIGWVVVSVLAAPLVGRFLVGALHEAESEEKRGPAETVAGKNFPEPVVGSVAAHVNRT